MIGYAETELDARGSVRLALRKEGWQYWTWQSESGPIRTHYIEAGDASNPPVLLIHGFGWAAQRLLMHGHP